MAGKFISIEGPDGAGKSTLARGLHSELALKGHQVVLTREPGDGPVGPQIRQILLEGVDIDSWTEVFLFLADRRQHVEQFIRPALERGDWVICDRFVDSTIVYQGYGRDLDIGLLRKLNKIATSGLMPDLTLVLDLPVEAALARIGSNDLFDGGAPSRGQNDRLDREPIEFHRRVREGFLAEARLEPDRFRIIDGEGVPSKVLEDAVFALSEHNIPEVRTKLLKLVVAVVHNRDKGRVVEDLIRNGFKFTIIGSTGGFLKEGNTTFLVGADESEKETLLRLIQQNCQMREQLVNVLPPDATPVGPFVPNPIKVPVGGAIAFVLDVEQFERF